MKHAPPTQLHCTTDPGWRWARTLVLAAAVASVLAWLLAWAGQDGIVQATAASLAALVAGALAWRLMERDALVVAWDGQRWTLSGQPGELTVMLDTGRWCLLRFTADGGGVRWWGVSARAAGTAWHLFRVAAHARRTLSPTGRAHGSS